RRHTRSTRDWSSDVCSSDLGDLKVDLGDAVRLLDFMFLGGSLDCIDAGDVNDDGQLLLDDPMGLLGYLFFGAKIPPPFPEPGLRSEERRVEKELRLWCSNDA